MLHNDDLAFLARFESLTLPGDAFRHREHIRLAWLVLRVDDAEVARRRIERGIRAFAAALGADGKYHSTITEAWIRLVEGAIAADPPQADERFDDWIGRHAPLLDSARLRGHFTGPRLQSDAARRGWVEPDLAPLPALPAA